MKTIKEWLQELPEPYRGQALANHKSSKWEIKNDKVNTLGNALTYGFDWANSIEGNDYWNKVAEGKEPVISLELPPTNALLALHAIALKKGFPVEDKISVYPGINNIWFYTLKEAKEVFNINLKNN